MTDASISIPDLKKVQRQMDRLTGREMRQAATASTRKMAQEFRRDMRARAPKKTGNLRRHIKYQVRRARKFEGIWGRVGVLKGKSGKEYPFYAYFIEYGTSRMPARPFIRPAFDSRKGAAVKTGSREFVQFVRKVGK